jgi:hypothetical protein
VKFQLAFDNILDLEQKGDRSPLRPLIRLVLSRQAGLAVRARRTDMRS